MYRYLLLNRYKLWGIGITFFGLSALFCLTNKRIDIDILLVSAGLTIFIFSLLLVDGYLTFRRKEESFKSPAFQALRERGFTEELTAYRARFLFTDKRLSGYVDNYLVRVDGTRKILGILIGIDYESAKGNIAQITAMLGQNGISINELFIEKEIQQVNVTPQTDIYRMIRELVQLLRENGIAPERITSV